MAALAVVAFWLVTPHKPIQAMNEQQEQLLNHPNWAAPFVPTPPAVVDAMLALADIKESDTVYDLGSGDGRIIIMAVEKYKAAAIGIEFGSFRHQLLLGGQSGSPSSRGNLAGRVEEQKQDIVRPHKKKPR